MKIHILICSVIILFAACSKEETEIQYQETLIFEENFDNVGDWLIDTVLSAILPGAPIIYTPSDQRLWYIENSLLIMNAWGDTVYGPPTAYRYFLREVSAYYDLGDVKNAEMYKVIMDVEKYSLYSSSTITQGPQSGAYSGGTLFTLVINGIKYSSYKSDCFRNLTSNYIESYLDKVSCPTMFEIDTGGANYLEITTKSNTTSNGAGVRASPERFVVDNIKILALE